MSTPVYPENTGGASGYASGTPGYPSDSAGYSSGTPGYQSGSSGYSSGATSFSGASSYDPNAGAHGSQTSTDEDSRPSVGELFGEISRDISTLMRQEVALAKAELQESAARVGKGAGMLGGAGLAGHFVLLFLSIALWWALGDSMGHGWSALIVALIWAIIAAALAVVGRSQLKQAKGLPQTTATVKKIPDAVRGNEESA